MADKVRPRLSLQERAAPARPPAPRRAADAAPPLTPAAPLSRPLLWLSPPLRRRPQDASLGDIADRAAWPEPNFNDPFEVRAWAHCCRAAAAVPACCCAPPPRGTFFPLRSSGAL